MAGSGGQAGLPHSQRVEEVSLAGVVTRGERLPCCLRDEMLPYFPRGRIMSGADQGREHCIRERPGKIDSISIMYNIS